ncbi:uroporphyrinogen-III synthase [Alicyclobacillus herbarius]|uniref:uroporphyrinogen-III synthase n=1 Tax=Alicyclobacillus herbarius TaxID=122960 RepID=UPI0003F800F1|nr:uroporphyrinogen-III synthase [Alicyclobacillus herbarius]
MVEASAGRRVDGDGLPLKGVQVLITRPQRQAEAVLRQVESLGARGWALPLIDIELVLDAAFCEQTAHVADFDAVVFTSQNAVAAVQASAERVAAPSKERWPPVFTVGKATERAAQQLAAYVQTPDGVRTGRDLFDYLADRLPGGSRVWFPHGNLTDSSLWAPLVGAGHVVCETVCYRTKRMAIDRASLRLLESAPGQVAVFLYSPSAAKTFFDQVGWFTRQKNCWLLAIGPTTAEACAEFDRPADAVASVPSDAGMVAALLNLVASASR